MKGDVAVPNQLEPWLLDLPEGLKKTDPYQQMAVRETECENIIFSITPDLDIILQNGAIHVYKTLIS